MPVESVSGAQGAGYGRFAEPLNRTELKRGFFSTTPIVSWSISDAVTTTASRLRRPVGDGPLPRHLSR
jgi:hypothetical protein